MPDTRKSDEQGREPEAGAARPPSRGRGKAALWEAYPKRPWGLAPRRSAPRLFDSRRTETRLMPAASLFPFTAPSGGGPCGVHRQVQQV